MAKYSDAAIFTIIFRKGLADRRRLPLSHVIRTLQEVDELIREVGKQVQKERGIKEPTGDFGIELLAGRSGMVFKAGSLRAENAVTRDLDSAQIVMARVLDTADLLEKQKPPSIDPANAPIIRRFARISGYQREDRTELGMEWRKAGQRTKTAKFTEAGIETIESISGAGFTVESVTLYGKLRELKDKSKIDEEGKFIWGELVADNSEVWRVRFPVSKLTEVLPLFSKQVMVTGDATYFKANNPRLIADRIVADPERDYLAAFDKHQGSDAAIFGDTDVQELLKEIRD
jgi:hypothetical protein